MPALLRQVSWPQLLHQPLRHAVAVLAVALGVALAFSVHLINESALGEFSAAVRQVNGQPDFELRAQRDGFDEALFARVAAQPGVALASAVIELDTQALAADGSSLPLRVVGLDALVAGPLMPALLPRPAQDAPRLAVIDPGAAFLNAAAARRLGEPASLRLRAGSGTVRFEVRGSVLADGPPLAVIDIAGAQAAFGWLGRVSRIDLRLVPGTDREALLRDLQLPDGVRAAAPDESAQRVSNVSRAYRVNLTVLALVALFTGAFLVFSILSLSVARRLPQLALLGVLGLSARERLAWVLAESALIGAAGSALGLALGTALAALALRLLSGDLGGAYFPGVTPRLQFGAGAALVYGALGVLVALAGGWLPARRAQRLAPAQALKGLGDGAAHRGAAWVGPLLLALGAALTQAPPLFEIPLAAYASVACLLIGGIACVPVMVGLLLKWTKPPRHALALLAVQRARHERDSATIAVAGVVASLALAVALTVMVTSFREAVTHWLDSVLPADLYARSAPGGGADTVFVSDTLVAQVRALPGVARVEGQRVASVQLDARRPAVALIARPLDDPAQRLPLLGELLQAPPGLLPVYASEPLASLYGLRAGESFDLPLPDGRRERAFVRGVWRDYARQHGAVTMADADYRRLTGDSRINDLALWLAPGADSAQLPSRIRALAGPEASLEFASAAEIRAQSLRIFDRSFAVTYWLQAVAIAIGLAGIAASFSAQVLARRREFGLLAHLGLTRAQVLAVVAGEGAVWSLAGVALGLLLGVTVSAVLVHVVNPQSFHWTMELLLPWGRLALLAAAMAAAGTATAWWAGRAAGGRQAALAVKEDW
ncbi:ABC transporter permease [uncultured Piscinibacter sp.]|uniref:FtsX-like permease family protein n=1 Tax=uncultured Piscinibacter sp. TaxID=1131835 RepID=UPI00262C4D05|nr:ABC transporter permease [uncultured Piscinibacter sp.]